MTEALLDDLVCDEDSEVDHDDEDASSGRPVVYGDAAYGSGDNLELLERLGAEPMVKTQPAVAPSGQFIKDDFDVDLAKRTVTCPNGKTVTIPDRDAAKVQVRFAEHCTGCPLRAGCIRATEGRTITIGRHEQRLQDARARQQDPSWQANYRANRPKVERKLAHLLRRHHGGRRVRMRGLQRIDQDWKLLAGAVNLARLATLGVRWSPTGWVTAPVIG